MKRKFGWTEKGIIGFVFSPLGAFFLTLCFLFHHYHVAEGPDDARVMQYVFGGTGLIFFCGGMTLLLSDIRRRNAQRRALEGGYYVMAKIADARVNRCMRQMGRSPYRVECHYQNPDTREAHVYFSRYLYFNPTDMLTGDEVPVYLDRMNEKIGFVDIDAVLPKVIIHR